MDISKIVDDVFSQPPKLPCSFLLGAIDAQGQIHANMFHVLMGILMTGAKKLYGDDITPNKLTLKQFDRLQSYIQSFGYTIKYKKNYLDDDLETPATINIWFEPYMFQTKCNGTFTL